VISEILSVRTICGVDPHLVSNNIDASNFTVLYLIGGSLHGLANAGHLFNQVQAFHLLANHLELGKVELGTAQVHIGSVDVLLAEVASDDGTSSKGHVVGSLTLVLEEALSRGTAASVGLINNEGGVVLAGN
jgi:hypothetical protein